MAAADQAGHPGGTGSLQTRDRILDRQHPGRRKGKLLGGEAVRLGMGLLAGHILTAHPKGKQLIAGRQQPLQQGADSHAPTGGDDHLAQASGPRLHQQAVHTGAQLQHAAGHQLAVMQLLAQLQRVDLFRSRIHPLQSPQRRPNPLAPATDRQTVCVGRRIPVDRDGGFGEGAVEGAPMTVALGLCQGAVHIPEQGFQGHGNRPPADPDQARPGCGQAPQNGTLCRPPLLPALDAQRWLLPAPLGALGASAALSRLNPAPMEPLPEPLLALLARRGHTTANAVAALLDPPGAPAAHDHFPQLQQAVDRLEQACLQGERVAVCGDYDADGMTSTALLIGVLGRLGARPEAAIPSRLEEGYGLNPAMVERLAAADVRLLVTVDNGVSAEEALVRAADLGLEVIITDHHTLPEQLPPHHALLHPQCTPEHSPYRGLAGVGLAYVLAAALAECFGDQTAMGRARDLFCIGTIADMAPLQGVNRRWLMDGLPPLAASDLAGLQALQRLAGVDGSSLDAQTVGFQIAPRINAVGRLGDPALVVELLTTDDEERALELARACDALNRQRRELCEAIEAEALALLEADGERLPAFLLLAQNHWHHGVIGIVAARLVERLGRPCALLAGEGGGRLRASVRAPRGFAVDQALTACADLLERFGGHPAAGGFSVRAEQLAALQERLEELACGWLARRGDGQPVEPEALLKLEAISFDFLDQQQRLAPFGIGHLQPVYWSSGCRVVSRKRLRGGHLQLELDQEGTRRRAIGWRWQGEAEQIPARVDVAFRLQRDAWQGEQRIQLELVGLRAHPGEEVVLERCQRLYWCRRQGEGLVVRNAAGEELCSDSTPEHPYLRALLQDAAMALGLAS